MNRLTRAEFVKAAKEANYPMDLFAGVRVVYNNTLPAYSTATAGQTYLIVGDFNIGAMANYPSGQDIELKFDDKTQEKYLQYFLSDNEHSIEDATMTDFLNDMISVSEQMDMTLSPTEIIKEIMKRCGFEGSCENHGHTVCDAAVDTAIVVCFCYYLAAVADTEGIIRLTAVKIFKTKPCAKCNTIPIRKIRNKRTYLVYQKCYRVTCSKLKCNTAPEPFFILNF